MAESIPVEHAHDHDGHHDHHEMTFSEKYIFPLDHKMIAMQYLFTGMAMAVIGGFFGPNAPRSGLRTFPPAARHAD
jgi:cytochrome c oxidase subunit 1